MPVPKPVKGEDLARNLLKPGFPFAIRDKHNKRIKVQIRRELKKNTPKTVNPQPKTAE